MATARNYNPNQTITLFDRSTNEQVKGVLYLNKAYKEAIIATINDEIEASKKVSTDKPEVNKKTLKSVIDSKKSSARWIDHRYTKQNPTPNFLNAKFLATILLFLSLIGFTSLVLPIAVSETMLKVSYLQNYISSYAKEPSLKSAATAKPTPYNNAVEYQVDPNNPGPKESQEFNLAIPAINLESKVIPDVDPLVDTVYKQQLMNGVAQARGSYLPGQKGTIFLFAHSTDTPQHILEYNAKFYAVKDLQNEDQIQIDYHGKHYVYKIYDRKITKPSDLDTIRSSGADLILQTCWPPGTDWQRLMVFAKQV